MSSIILIENKEYRVDELKKNLNLEYDEIMRFCKENRIVNTISKGGSRSTDIVKFSFVGCLVLKNGENILFLPKYFKDTTQLNKSKYIKLMLRVLQKYKKTRIENLIDDEILDEEDEFLHLYGTIGYLIQYYSEHGLYVNEYSEKVFYGSSEIDWQSTIDQGTAYLTRSGSSVYLDLIKDEMEYDWLAPITEIHKSVLNRCTTLIKEWGLDEILDWPEISLEVNENWMDKPVEAEYWIDKAMQSEFQDQKLLLLKNLLLFLKEINSMKFNTDYQLIGSKYFQNIWERCCSEVLQHNPNLQEEILKPVWENKTNTDRNRKTLKPDFLKHLLKGNTNTLLIFDAKYYAIEFHGNHVKHNPGIDDVSKQYMYHQALMKFIKEKKVSKVYNAFLFPALEETEQVFGKATLEFVTHLPPVFLIKLNAEEFFSMYLKGQHWSLNQLMGLLKKMDDY